MVTIGVYGISDSETNKQNKCLTTDDGLNAVSFEIDGIMYLLDEDDINKLSDLILYHKTVLDDYIESEDE